MEQEVPSETCAQFQDLEELLNPPFAALSDRARPGRRGVSAPVHLARPVQDGDEPRRQERPGLAIV